MRTRPHVEVVRQSVVIDVALALFIVAALVGAAGYSGLAGSRGGAVLALAALMLGTAIGMLCVGILRVWRARVTRHATHASPSSMRDANPGTAPPS